jgi:ferrous iron transport protein B
VIVLWVLQTFNFRFQMVDIEHSMLAYMGRAVSWLFAPLGFGSWQITIALITSVLGKEIVVATFGVILGGEGAVLDAQLQTLFTPHGAYAFMAFILLASPCIAAIAATKKELGSGKLMFATMVFQCVTAYLVALVINQAGNLWAYDRTLAISIIAGVVAAAILAYTVYRVIRNRRRGVSGCGRGCAGCAKAGNCAAVRAERGADKTAKTKEGG